MDAEEKGQVEADVPWLEVFLEAARPISPKGRAALWGLKAWAFKEKVAQKIQG